MRQREFVTNTKQISAGMAALTFFLLVLHVLRHTGMPDGFTNISFLDLNWHASQVGNSLSWILLFGVPILAFTIFVHQVDMALKTKHLGKTLAGRWLLAVVIGYLSYFAAQSQVIHYGWEGLIVYVVAFYAALVGLILAPIIGWASGKYILSRRSKRLLFPSIVPRSIMGIAVIGLVVTVWQYTVFTRDLSACGTANGWSTQSNGACLAHEAAAQKDSTLCSKARVPAVCYNDLAFLLKEPELCLEVSKPENKVLNTSYNTQDCLDNLKPYTDVSSSTVP